MANSVDPGKKGGNKVSSTAWLSLLLALLAFAVYVNTLNNGFAYDDMSAITKNTIVTKGISAVPRLFATPYRLGFYTTTNDLYRPLSLVTFAIEYQLYGLDAAPYHFINVLLFVACVILLFRFLDTLFYNKRTAAAFIAALLFAVHPIHTEVVANIKGRDELLCFFFAFLSLVQFLRYVRVGEALYLMSGAMCLFLAVLSKETVISFLLIVPLIFFLYYNQAKRKSWHVFGSTVLVITAYLFIRFSILHAYNADHGGDIKFIDNFLVSAPSTASRLATEINIMGSYLKLSFLPFPLICDYSYNSIPYSDFTSVSTWFYLLVYTLLLGLSIFRLTIKNRDPLAFGIIFYLLTLALFSNFFFLIGAAMGERFLFFASAGFCWVLGLLISRFATKGAFHLKQITGNRKLVFVTAPILAVFSAMTVARNFEWKDSLTLYYADSKKAPGNARLYYFLANELLIQNNSADQNTQKLTAKEAIDYLKKAISIYPGFDEANRVMGNAYFVLGNPDSAIDHFKTAILLQPGDLEAMNNLNVAYFSSARYEDFNKCQ